MTQNIFQKPTSLQKVADLQYDFPTLEVEQLYSFLGKDLPEEDPSVTESEAPTPVVETETPFWKVYTPMNILREIHYRITSKSE